jgi:adenosylcobinamide amidohydrolase
MERACVQLTTVKQEDYLRYYLTTGMSNDVYIMPKHWVYETPPEQKGLIRRITRPLPCADKRVPAYEVVASSLDDAIATVNYLATVTEKDTDRIYVRVLAPETEAKMSFAEGLL